MSAGSVTWCVRAGIHVGRTVGIGSYTYTNVPCGREYKKYAGQYDSSGLTFDVYYHKPHGVDY